jgi:large-conductance mechanosensitive channel
MSRKEDTGKTEQCFFTFLFLLFFILAFIIYLLISYVSKDENQLEHSQSYQQNKKEIRI